MSHVAEVETKIQSLDSLKAACERLGWTFMEGQRTYNWYKTWVGDTPPPAWVTPDKLQDWIKSLGTCDHAIRVPGCTYEVGVVRNADGTYTLRWDYYEHRLKKAMGGAKGEVLLQAYAVEQVLREAKRKGHRRVTETRLQNGSVKVRIQLGA